MAARRQGRGSLRGGSGSRWVSRCDACRDSGTVLRSRTRFPNARAMRAPRKSKVGRIENPNQNRLNQNAARRSSETIHAAFAQCALNLWNAGRQETRRDGEIINPATPGVRDSLPKRVVFRCEIRRATKKRRSWRKGLPNVEYEAAPHRAVRESQHQRTNRTTPTNYINSVTSPGRKAGRSFASTSTRPAARPATEQSSNA